MNHLSTVWYAETSAESWEEMLSDFDGHIHPFDTDTPSGHRAEYYRQLILVVDTDLKTEWANYDSPIWEEEPLERYFQEMEDYSDWSMIQADRDYHYFLATGREWNEGCGDWGCDHYHDSDYDLSSDELDRYNAQEEARRIEDRLYESMAQEWAELDFMAYERSLDAMDQVATIHQHGGPRGWKAGKVALLRLAEAA
jgi:hypothetical protein